ncbi:hypothetical protein BBO_07784 [Beauveria brongniartii RCEF 3172]|uniref:2EXR domain-containing protein n=1 Tax=Beauveria brongniartii RCEF 3172 TaxID=1081107 RepID=A0A166S9Q0_9HYPO|nr:hypothetical protein BBO_07784 [Beauveria brongniartii RCEF 3172]
MANTFHPFSRLPADLRHMIWKAAVWDRSVSSANFFTILPSSGAYLATSPRVRLGPPTLTDNVCNCHRHVGSWKFAMGSGCMVDSGLWEACYESRAVMKLRYPTAQGYDGETATGLATDLRGITRRYTFVPSRDVLVIGLYNFIHAFQNPDREIDCVFDVPPATNNSVVLPFSVLPSTIFGAQGNHPTRLRLGDMRHIAVWLDRDWEQIDRRKIEIIDLFAAITRILHSDTVFYLYWGDMGHAGIAEATGDKNARFYTENGGHFGHLRRL